MTNTKTSKTEQAVIDFADAILRLWCGHLELSAMVSHGHRARLEHQRSSEDPLVSYTHLQIAMEQAVAGKDTPDIIEAKIEMVASLLYVWYRVQLPLRNQILKSVSELAMIRGVPLDAAHYAAIDVIGGARHVENVLAEKRAEGLRKIDEREAAREKALCTQMSERLEREALQGG